MSDDGSIGFVERFLDAQISESVLAEYGTSVHISRHKTALSGQSLKKSNTIIRF
jgi:hypothetical protein